MIELYFGFCVKISILIKGLVLYLFIHKIEFPVFLMQLNMNLFMEQMSVFSLIFSPNPNDHLSFRLVKIGIYSGSKKKNLI